MNVPRPRSWAQWLRRIAQTAFFVLFLVLLLRAQALKIDPQLFLRLDPLALVATGLASHTLAHGALVAVGVLIVTLILGRVFCGWLCPLGAIHNAAAWIGRMWTGALVRAEDRSAGQRVKYYVLVLLLVMAALGAQWSGVFNPIPLLYRSVTSAVVPGAQYSVEAATTSVYQADPRLGPLKVTTITEPVYRFFRDRVFVFPRQAFNGGALIALIFLAIVALNLHRNRFWCRYVCPLGGLLGLLSKRPVMRLVNNEELCTGCGRCAARCPSAAQPNKPNEWLPTECYGCWNCVAACNQKALHFTVGSPFRAPTQARLNLSKRMLLASAAGGVAGFLTMKLAPQVQAKSFNPALIRPPGSRAEKEFLQRCLRCGLCMRICPTGGLQPTLTEAGIEGLWTPVLVPKIGYCEFGCNACGQQCPTEAIAPLPLEEKKTLKIGLAFIDTTRCLPYAGGRDCIVCEEHCPLPRKAVFFAVKEVKLRDGSMRTVKQPLVDSNLCIGCGICETKCPFKDLPAIRVASANEARHPDNQPLLPAAAGFATTPTSPAANEGASANPYGG